MAWLTHLAGELMHTATDGSTWSATALALVLGFGTFSFGLAIVRRTHLLRDEAGGAEVVGVSLSTGLLLVASVWAAVRSNGQSAFLPVAVALVAGAILTRSRAQSLPWRSIATVLFSGALFVVAVALLYGATMAPSVRDGLQPVEYPDEAFYAVLSRDLAATGRETTLSATGFGPIAGLPAQSWYHWGELWLGAAVGWATGVAPMLARYQVVLPLVLLATTLLAGTLVRVALKTTSRLAFAFGAAACLFLVPVPLIAGPFFSSWAFGMTLGITLYGLAAPTALLAVYAFATTDPRTGWRNALFRAAIAAALLPAHLVVAGLALIGATAAAVARAGEVRAIPPGVSRVIVFASGLLLAGGVWGLATGHGLGGAAAAGTSRVASFNPSWSVTIGITIVGGGIFLAIPIAWLIRAGSTLERSLYVFVVAMVAIGAVVWGARLADANAFYAYFAGLAVFAPPVAAIATLRVFERLRERRWFLMAATVALLAIVQLAWGAAYKTLPSLVASGPLPERDPIPIEILDRIRALPANARLAYACRPLEEATFAQPQLLSIDVHTSRHVVPLCFQADGSSWLVGGLRDPSIPNESWVWAPQRELFPDAAARPSEKAVATWLRSYGIEYLYVDTWRPNPVGEFAIQIATVGTVQLLRLR